MKIQASKRIVLLSAALAMLTVAFVGCASDPSDQANGGLQPTTRLTVHVDQPATRISPTVYGLMTEEINHAYDGGLYAELIQNRIFKDNAAGARTATAPPAVPLHWSAVGDAKIVRDDNNPVNTTALTSSLRIDIGSADAAHRAGTANDGFWGIPVWANTTYRASFYARAGDGFSGGLTIGIESNDGATVFASAVIPGLTADWKKYETTLTTGDVKPSSANRFVISTESKGTVWLSLVSLFPPTYNNRPNGLRIDIMQKLADMHPAFLRFPGGNYLEGNDIANYFNWKQTIGRLEDRPGHQCPWGYRSSDGLGLLEFLEWCEDLHMEPVLAVFAGYTLDRRSVTREQLPQYVQDAVDEIEYVTGDPSTEWGARRAKDGHPAPFVLHYVEVGNEDNLGGAGSTYEWRFKAFYDAIKAKHPLINIISTAHVRDTTPDLFDDHAYPNPRAMLRMTHRYDTWPRTSPAIFFGEWATRDGQQIDTPNMNDTLPDAAWLMGLERDSDVVRIASYAPLFVNVGRAGGDNTRPARQWATNLIGYDALNSFGSPSYYMQKMYSENRGDVVLPAELTMPPPDPASIPAPRGSIGVGTWATTSEYKDIKVTQADKPLFQSDFSSGMDGWSRGGGRGPVTWSVVDGALRQTGDGTNRIATAGDTSWTDYTMSLKARKIEGGEGFLVLIHYQDRNNMVWWNVGGWNNTASGLEQTSDGNKATIGQTTPTSIEANKWYDIRIEVAGRDIKCYLDDKLITEATEAPPIPPGPVFAEATRVDASGDVILKIVNIAAAPQTMQINLRGVKHVDARAAVQVLSGKLSDVNTIDNPTKITPQEADIDDAARTFTHEFPAYSVSVIRLRTR
jgi:alpha-L-arabinofuranosidase